MKNAVSELVFCLVVLFTFLIPATTLAQTSETGTFMAEGIASHYADYLIGQRTRSGEIYSGDEMTAAHRYLPFGTRVRVEDTRTGNAVVVRINDRGPFGHPDRIIDLSHKAAAEIAMMDPGLIPIRMSVLDSIDPFFYTLDPAFELWSLQVSAVSDPGLARHHLEILGPKAIEQHVDINGQRWIRILYGVFQQFADLDAEIELLAARGYPGALKKYLIDDHLDLAQTLVSRDASLTKAY